jgi:predicted XRE-type DNA-binding protein
MSDEKVEIYESSGNIFTDLELKNAEELYARAHIGIEVLRILEERKLKQKEIGKLLDIRQSEVSHLMNGHFNRFSEGKLLGFLKKLDREITLVITQPDQSQAISLTL